MTFTALQHKFSYLSGNFSDPMLRDLSDIVRSSAGGKGDHGYSSPIVSTLELDVVYCVLKHRQWASCHIFKDVFVEFLVVDYGLEAAHAERLYKDVKTRLEIYFPYLKNEKSIESIEDEVSQKREKEFLTYVFISAMTVKDESFLVHELGIGTGLLKRIKKLVSHLVRQGTRDGRRDFEQQDVHRIEFLPELEVLLSEIMINLSSEIRKCSWAIDLERLKYRLQENPIWIESKKDDRYISACFELMLQLGLNGKRSFSDLKCLDEKGFMVNVDDLKLILEILENVDLIYSQPGRGRYSHDKYWELTAKGEDLTAEAFSHRYLKKMESPCVISTEELCSLRPAYQAALISNLPSACASEILDYLKVEARTLSPRGLEAIFKRATTEKDRCPETIKRLFKKISVLALEAGSPWLRSAACRMLGAIDQNIIDQEELKRVLITASEQDSSQTVKDAAMETALKVFKEHEVLVLMQKQKIEAFTQLRLKAI